ncbi:hypothetical protein AB0K51_12005 [Kitasatospora sp. NPDC049285]|uniref:hypothetical protein n=1 Tax=Kitasatospora sp. NPDC049285 TaxID=3157096 RepID=UPI003431F057
MTAEAEYRYRPCSTCRRCTAGTDLTPTADGDCWDAFLTRTLTAMEARRRAERAAAAPATPSLTRRQ